MSSSSFGGFAWAAAEAAATDNPSVSATVAPVTIRDRIHATVARASGAYIGNRRLRLWEYLGSETLRLVRLRASIRIYH
jgi:hypothetical protein